ASGTLVNGRGQRRQLPSIWHLRLSRRGGRLVIAEAATEENIAASELLQVNDDAERREVLERHAALDRRQFLAAARDIALATVRSDPTAVRFDATRTRAGLEFLHDQAVTAGNKAEEAVLLADIAQDTLERADFERARVLAQTALALAIATGDPDALAA